MSINPLDEINDGIPKLSDFAESEFKYSEDRDQEKEDSEHVPVESSQKTSQQQSSTEGETKEKPGLLQTGAEYAAAIPTGVVDFGVDLLNKISPGGRSTAQPMVDDEGNLHHVPKFQSEGAQALREISSVVVPTIWATAKLKGLGKAAHGKIGWSLGNDAAFKWFATTGLAAGAGALVDETASVQERDHNLSSVLKRSWPKTWGWIPDNWATLDSDSPEIFRQKNRNEGIGLGMLADILGPIGRLTRNRQKLKQATNWVPKNEKASAWLKRKTNKVKLSENPIENDLLQSAKRRDDQLSDLGRSALEDGADETQPILGVHDMYDYTEQGVRASDEGGIVGAAVDQVKIVKQIDTRYGRIRSIFSPKDMRELLTGKQNPLKFMKKLGKELKETEVDYIGSKGKVVKHSDSLRAAERLGAELYGSNLEDMKNILRPLSQVDPETGARKLTNVAYKGVMKAISKYSDEFINLDLARAQGLAATSTAGQISDMAEGVRLMDNTPAVGRGQEQILDRIEFLMNLKAQTSLTRQKAFNIGDIVNRLRDKGSELLPIDAVKAMSNETNDTLRSLERLATESKNTIETLRQVKEHRPQMLGPLMLAYEVTDGKVASMSALNQYVRNSTGTISKAFFDGRADMPSAWTQGVWANIYNSILSAVGTPLKAALSNTILMVERPVATFAGAIAGREWDTLRRAHYMYNVGFADTLQRSFSHMNQVFKRASVDPNSVGYILRDDIARKNEQQMDLLKGFSAAAEQEGNYGPSVVVSQIEAMNDLAEHPWLRFSANAMSAFDGFTRSYIGNIEARARAYDKIMEGGGQITPNRVRAMARNVYGEMFDETGVITDKAVEYASREIAMNLDNSAVTAVNELVKTVPAIKPFVMFPKTSINMMRFAGSHNPMGLFVDQVNAFRLPFEEMDEFKVDELLSSRGVGLSGNKKAAYDTIRAELKGRKAIGTLSVMGAGFLFTQDRLRGNGLFDKTRQRTRRELGWKPKTYKGLDGNWYSYDNMGPITDWLSLTSDIMDNFDTLDEPTISTLLNRVGFILSANLTDKSFTAGLEPLGDVLAGNPAAAARWAGSFGSGLLPGSGFRNEFARLITPQLKEVEQEFGQILANRNPGLKQQLPDLYDWMDGSKVGEPMGFFARAWNVYSPLWKVSEGISPEKQFLIDIEFDGRPTLRTNGKGIEYSPEQRSEITRLMGESGYFAKEVRRIMNSKQGRSFRKDWKKAAEAGVYMDRKIFLDVQYQLTQALRTARQLAEANVSSFEDISRKQLINTEIERATRAGDVQRVLDLQRN